MKLLAIDPSSTCCGYAMFDRDQLIDAGRCRPAKADDPPNERIRTMVRDLLDVVIEQRPDVIVLEDTTGKVQKRRHGGAGAGLAIYGKAVGYVLCAMEKTGLRVECVLENTWTRDMSKADRQLSVAAQFPSYDPAQDKGMDVSDAVYLGQWWMQEEALKKRSKPDGQS